MSYKATKEGRSSLFKVEIEKGRKAYRYDVDINCKTQRKDFSLAKQSNSSLKNIHNQYCRKVIKHVFNKTNGFEAGVKEVAYCYNGKTMLYTNKPVNSQTFDLKPADISSNNLEFAISADLIIVTILPNAEAPELEYFSFEKSLAKSDNFTTDHSVRAFFELLTSEYPISSGEFQHLQAGAIFQTKPLLRQPNKVKIGMSAFDGMQKGIRIVDKSTALMVLDLRRSLEFGSFDQRGNPLSLAEIYNRFVRDENDKKAKADFVKLFRGVKMLISYDTSRTLDFYCLSEMKINDTSFNVDGKSLPQFYRDQHQVNLKYSNMVGAQSFDNVKKGFVYPLEVLYVLPGQFVPQEKHDLPLDNFLKPQERYDFIMKQIEFLSTGNCAEYLKQFGIKLLKDSNKVQIKSLALPKIRFKANSSPLKTNNASNQIIEKQVEPNSEKGSFFRDAQFSPLLYDRKLLKNWAIAYEKDAANFNEVKKAVENLINLSKTSEFQLPEPQFSYAISLDDLEQFFDKAVEKHTQLILYVGNENHSHSRLKLFEAQYKILTQQILPTNLNAGGQTMKNFVMKLNSKCFGLNFLPVFGPSLKQFDLEKNPQLLVIGYDVSHPTHASPKEIWEMRKNNINLDSWHPSVVGISANKNFYLGSFSADFFYQESRREELSKPRFQKAIKQIIECVFKSSKNTRKPTELLIYRDGVSEGQYNMVIRNELKAIKTGYAEAMQIIDPELAKKIPKITLIVGTKRHNKRFFHVDSNGNVMNTCPGDVVNGTVTRQDMIEFWLQSHFPLQGSAQLTQYNVLVDELNIGRSNLEQVTLILANMHQISGCPTSLPLPIYLADEIAARGQEVYKEFNHLLNYSNEKPAFVKNFVKPDNLDEYFDKLTNEFGYAGSRLQATRIN